MKPRKLPVAGLLIFQCLNLLGQQLTGNSNAIYLNTKKVNQEIVKLPLITWISPEQENSNVTLDSIELIVSVNSSSTLKSLKLQRKSSVTTSVTELPLEGFTGSREIRMKIGLSQGLNFIELTAENSLGGKVSSSRVIDLGHMEFSNVAGDSRIASPLLFVKENSVRFLDEHKDGILNGNETASVQFILENKGRVTGKNLTLFYSLAGNENNITVKPGVIADLDPGKEVVVTAQIVGGQNLQAGKTRLTLVVQESRGFDTDGLEIEFNTQSYNPPALSIVDVVFNSVIGNRLKRNAPAAFQVLIQNTGFGLAENVKVLINFPENIFFDENQVKDIGNLAPGESRKLSFEFIPTTRYKNAEIPIKISLVEKFGNYGSEKIVTPVIDQPLVTMQLNVAVDSANMAAGKVRPVILPMSLRSDVDLNIPVNQTQHPNRYALVIGNEDYVQFQPLLRSEQNVAFARNDAIVFRDYLIKTMGVPERNAFLLLDATRGQITRELERISQLARLSRDSELIFYYAGHGLPDFETRRGYIIPVDVSGGNIRDGGISLADLYSKLSSSQSSRITVFLDACFSGGGRGENGLLAARTVKIKPVGDLVDGNIIVFTATSSEEVSLPLKQESHGLFTYYLLRKFKESLGNVTMQELRDFLENEVPKSSLVENGIRQSPQVLVSPKLNLEWLSWRF